MKPKDPTRHRNRCDAILVATFRRERLVTVAYEHRSHGCLTRGCYGRVDEQPLARWQPATPRPRSEDR